ncbi:MAG: membrane protein insertion efficiency factor YidD [Flavobacteriales bacterium]|nr:membrane protein insertion efficiency factor YidD [Flavobacteriales bacterium]
MRIISVIFIYIIKIYQLIISPVLGSNCRYHPTCSNYFIQCLEKYNIITAIYLGFKRIIKCHPFGGSGYDPIP